MKRSLLVLLIIMTFCVSLFAEKTEAEKELGLTKKLQYETARVLELSNNQTVLDEIYSFDWYIKVSPLNSEYLTFFQEDINTYKSIEIKRERLQYVFNQKKSMQMASLVPNALSVATVAFSAGNPLKAAIAIAGTALNMATSYVQNKKNIELEFLQSQWELDDEARNAFNNLYTGIRAHLTNMANEYGFGNDDFGSSKTISSFIKEMNANEGRPKDRILIGKRYENELGSYPEYWRTLALAYFEDENYVDALSCIEKYEEWYLQVFYHDFDNTHLLMVKAYCLDAVMQDPKEKAKALESIVDEIIVSQETTPDSAQQYYCYLVYRNLATYTGDSKYLEKAWNILGDMLYSNARQYEKDLSSYFAYDYIVQGEKEINKLIYENNTKIANLKEQRTGTKSKAKKEDIDREIKNLEEKNKELKANLKQLDASVKKQIPPSEALIISLTKEFKDLSRELGKTTSSEYLLRMDILSEVMKDDFFRCTYLGESLGFSDIEASFDNHSKFLIFGKKEDEMVFSVPLTYFSFVSDDFTTMELHIFNERYGIDLIIPYVGEDGIGWDYEIIRPTTGEIPDMSNTVCRITIITDGPMIELKKGTDIPTLFFTFIGDNNQLERSDSLSFSSESIDELNQGFFSFK